MATSKVFADGFAFLLVALAAGYLGHRFFRKYGASVLAAFFLRIGRVGWAMRLRPKASPKACGGSCDCS